MAHFSKFDLGYSKKNVPIPSQKEYRLQLIRSVEKFVNNLRWRALFYLNPSEKPTKETFGFKSIRASRHINEIKDFENRLKIMIRDVVFRPYTNDFQEKLKRDINDIVNNPNIIVAADKTTNNYELNTNQYNDLLQRNIQKDFKKAANETVVDDIQNQKEVVSDFDLEKRVMYSQPMPAYVTLKDNKPNFDNDPKCRLINPSKIGIGKISKQILSRVVDNIKVKTKLNLWKNSDSVIQWFENIENKHNVKFIQFDICYYYGSISKELFSDTIQWAKTLTTITEKEEKVIFEAKQSLLSDGGNNWKKRGDPKFWCILY